LGNVKSNEKGLGGETNREKTAMNLVLVSKKKGKRLHGSGDLKKKRSGRCPSKKSSSESREALRAEDKKGVGG